MPVNTARTDSSDPVQDLGFGEAGRWRVRVWIQQDLPPCSEPEVPVLSPASCAGGHAGPGHSGTLFAETEFPCLCFSIIILAGGIFSSGKHFEGERCGCVPACSKRELTLSSARLPAVMIF